MLWASDSSGAVVWFNSRWLSFIGNDLARDLAAGWAARVHPDDHDRCLRAYEEAVRTGVEFRHEYRLRRQDGVWRWIRDTAAPRRDPQGRYLGHTGVAVDVTEEKAAVERLHASERMFRRFAEATDDVVAVFNGTGDAVTFINSAYDRVWGASSQALKEDIDYWRQIVHPDDIPLVESGLQTLMKGELQQILVRIVRPRDGEVRIVDNRAFPVFDDHGKLVQIGNIVRDVTDLVRAREELEKRVEERTAELRRSQEEQRLAQAALAQAQKLETVARLTGGVAHDFNNLLTVVIGGLDMIVRHPDRADRIVRIGQAALDAARRGERLTRQLLGFSRKQEFRPQTVEVLSLIRSLEPLLRGASDDAAPVELEIPEGVAFAHVDPVQFEAALLNLLVNAHDALEGRAGTIRVRVQERRLGPNEIADLPPGDYVRVSVIDNGPGMAPEVAARAFEPFFTTKAVGAGSGLGLAQVYGFARHSGGAAEIVTAPGAGTAVSVYLPGRMTPTVVSPVEAPSGGAVPSCRARVLLVEDDPGVRAIAESLLKDLGCEVISAADGPSALAALQADPGPDLLLSDVVMPGGLSGVELAAEAVKLRPGLRVLLSTGYARGELDKTDTPWPVLFKPYRSMELAKAVRDVMEGGSVALEVEP